MPFDRSRTVRFDGSGNLEGQNRANTSGNTNGLRIYVHSPFGYCCLGCFDNGDARYVACRIRYTGSHPTLPTRIKRINNIPPASVARFAYNLGAGAKAQPTENDPADSRSQPTIDRDVFRERHRNGWRGG